MRDLHKAFNPFELRAGAAEWYLWGRRVGGRLVGDAARELVLVALPILSPALVID